MVDPVACHVHVFLVLEERKTGRKHIQRERFPITFGDLVEFFPIRLERIVIVIGGIGRKRLDEHKFAVGHARLYVRHDLSILSR